MSFPPVLNGFSHCGTHRDFDLACFRPGCVVSAAARTVYCATVRPIFHPAVLPASAPRLTSGLGLPGFEFRGGVPVPVGRSRCNNGLSTVYSVARTAGDPVCRTLRRACGRQPRHQTLLGYGGPRRRILKATAALKSLRLYARVHGGGLRAERIPTNLCEEVFTRRGRFPHWGFRFAGQTRCQTLED